MTESLLPKVFSFPSMDRLFPILETLHLSCLSGMNLSTDTELLGNFQAPNLRHLQLSDLEFMPLSLLSDNAATCPSIVTLSIGPVSVLAEGAETSMILTANVRALGLANFC